MPHTIAFDTNYLRSFGDRDYRAGQLPKKLHEQIAAAFARGDLVVLSNTVRLEANAWLKQQSEIAHRKLVQATDLLQQAGHKVVPATIEAPAELDILTVFKAAFPDIALLEPTVDDFTEAERRTSFRLPPLPKNPEGEEFRDRIIWCQILNHSKIGGGPILIVSGDRLFRNGADSEEGQAAGIENVEDETDLDQWLDRRPEHIQFIIDQILMFSPELKTQGIEIQADNLVAVEELRNVFNPSGMLVQRFMLRTTDVSEISAPVPITLVSLGNIPLAISLEIDGKQINIQRDISAEENEQLARNYVHSTMSFEQVQNELKAIVRS